MPIFDLAPLPTASPLTGSAVSALPYVGLAVVVIAVIACILLVRARKKNG